MKYGFIPHGAKIRKSYGWGRFSLRFISRILLYLHSKLYFCNIFAEYIANFVASYGKELFQILHLAAWNTPEPRPAYTCPNQAVVAAEFSEWTRQRPPRAYVRESYRIYLWNLWYRAHMCALDRMPRPGPRLWLQTGHPFVRRYRRGFGAKRTKRRVLWKNKQNDK